MKSTDLSRELQPMVLAAVFAALISVGAFLQIALPFTPVPITLQTLFVILAGVFLRPLWALAAVGLYLFAGIIGLPVFAGGARGFSVIMGPSGGFLIGFMPAAVAVSLIIRGGGDSEGWTQVLRDGLALLVGTLIIYAVGYPWITVNLGWEWRIGLARAVLPYLPGDGLKIIAAALLAASRRKIFSRNT